MIVREIELINEIKSYNDQQQNLVGTLYRNTLICKTNDLKVELYRLTGKAYMDYTKEEIENALADSLLT